VEPRGAFQAWRGAAILALLSHWRPVKNRTRAGEADGLGVPQFADETSSSFEVLQPCG
jgi:hypothetical protein